MAVTGHRHASGGSLRPRRMAPRPKGSRTMRQSSPRDDVCMSMVADVHMARIPCKHVQTITLAKGSSRGIWKYVQMCQLMQPGSRKERTGDSRKKIFSIQCPIITKQSLQAILRSQITESWDSSATGVRPGSKFAAFMFRVVHPSGPANPSPTPVSHS